MEAKLKKQRNKLFLRVILILLAVWLTISAVFCVIRLNIEKTNAYNQELSDISLAKQVLTLGNGELEAVNYVFLNCFNIVYNEEDPSQKFDSQIIITDRKNNQILADSKDSIGVRFSIKHEKDSLLIVGLLNYHSIRDALSDEDLSAIETYLNTNRDDGNYYELVCTKMQIGVELIPLELKIVLVNGKDDRMTLDDNVAVFDLSGNMTEETYVYESGTLRRNTIPKSFLLEEKYNKDYIGSLNTEQRRNNVDMIRTGTFEYLFYSSDYLNYVDDVEGNYLESHRLQYAREINLLDNCKYDLFLGVSIAFVFFFTIAAILCIMIWRTVKAQIIQEQKRLDLTGALAHDIKTPLFVISGYAYSLKENIDENEREEYLDKIIEQTDEVNDLVHKMLNFSKLDSYSMTLNKTDFDLSELAREIADDHGALPDHKSIVFNHSGDNTINADKELVKTALQNLIDNAIQYSLPDSEITIDVKDKCFSVSNRAEPLTKAELKQIRQPYMRKDKSRSRKGNGLGLSIVQSIAEQHDARFEMEMKDDILTCSITFHS